MSETESKNKPASGRKLQKQREEGNLAAGQDLSGLLAAALGLAVFAATASLVWEKLQFNIIAILETIHLPFEEATNIGLVLVGKMLIWTIIPVVAATIAAAFVTLIIYNGGIVFAIKPVLPQLNRVSLKSGFKRIYGKRGWVELAFLIVRLGTWLTFVVVVLLIFIPRLLRSTECSGLCQADQVRPMVWLLMIGAVVALILAAAIDMIVQRRLYLDDQKMTESEVKRERKESFGSSEVRNERNRLRREDAQGSPVQPGIKNATLVVFDGEGNAVAINYTPPENKLPRIVAKSRNPEATARLLNEAAELQLHQIKSAEVTAGGINVGLGEVLQEEAFESFADVLHDAFGG